MGETLFSLIRNRNLVAYPAADMREHVTNATGVETPRGFRLAKEKASKKIDLAVALSMACGAAIQTRVIRWGVAMSDEERERMRLRREAEAEPMIVERTFHFGFGGLKR